MAKGKKKATSKKRTAKKAPAKPSAPSKPKAPPLVTNGDPTLDRAIAQAYAEYKRLQAIEDDHYEHLRAVHLAAAHLWHLRSDEAYFAGNHDGARKASMTAESHAKLAAKLARDSVVDRVAKLEALVRERRDFGAELEGLS